MTSDADDGRLRVTFVPGVMPDKWARIWAERMPGTPLELALVDESEQTAVLYDGRADMCFVRLPVDDRELHVIPLYSEVPVVVVPKGHFVEAADAVTLDDLSEETVHPVPPLTVKEAVETIAAGVGVVVVPMSVARLHHRKDVVHRPVTDAPESRIGLAWRRDRDDARLQTFVGVVRGRRPNSSRGAAGDGEPQPGGRPAPATRQPKPPAGGPRRAGRGRRR